MDSAEQFSCARDCIFATFLDGHICLDDLGDAAFCVDHPFRLQGPLSVIVNQSYPRSLPGEKDRRRSAIANLA
jgi:hypothetical protein